MVNNIYKVKINDNINCGYIQERVNSIKKTSVKGSGNESVDFYGEILGDGFIGNINANGHYYADDNYYYTVNSGSRINSIINGYPYDNQINGNIGSGILFGGAGSGSPLGLSSYSYIGKEYQEPDSGHPDYNTIYKPTSIFNNNPYTDSGNYIWGPLAGLSFRMQDFFKNYISTTSKIAETKLTSLAFSQISKSYNRKDSEYQVFNAIMVGNWTVYQKVYNTDFKITNGNDITIDIYRAIPSLLPEGYISNPIYSGQPGVEETTQRQYSVFQDNIVECTYHPPLPGKDDGYWYDVPVGGIYPSGTIFLPVTKLHPYVAPLSKIANFHCSAECELYEGKLTPYATVFTNTKVLIKLDNVKNTYTVELDSSNELDYKDYNLFLNKQRANPIALNWSGNFEEHYNDNVYNGFRVTDDSTYEGINTLRTIGRIQYRDGDGKDYIDRNRPSVYMDPLMYENMQIKYYGNNTSLYNDEDGNLILSGNRPQIVNSNNEYRYRDYNFSSLNKIYIPDNLSDVSGVPKVINSNGIKSVESNFADIRINDVYSDNSKLESYRLCIHDDKNEYFFAFRRR